MTQQTYAPGERAAESLRVMEARLTQRLRQMERRVIMWGIISGIFGPIPATGVSIAIAMLEG